MQILLLAQIVTHAQDPTPASHIDRLREVKQNPMKSRARKTHFPALKLCPILGL